MHTFDGFVISCEPFLSVWQLSLTLVASSQLSEGGKERMELPQSRQNSSFEAPTKSYSLTIQNTTICSSGTYRCALQELGGQRNFSGTVILKVTGELTLLPLTDWGVLSVGPEVSPLPESDPAA